MRTVRRAAPEPARARPGSGTFAALAVAPYRRLFFSGTLGFLAVQSQMIARGWLARQLTGSNSGLGGVFLAFGIPLLVATPWGGVAADRLSKRAVLLGAQGALALSGLWIGLAVALDVVEYWMLLGASAVQAFGFAFMGPARMAFTGELVGRSVLPNAIVLAQMSLNSTRILGPSLAGVLIGVPAFGTAGVYFLTSGLTLIAMTLTATLPPGRAPADRASQTPGAELLDGLRYVRRHPTILLLLVTSFFVVMLAFPYTAFLPSLADETFDVGPSGYGVLSAAGAIGALAVSLLIARRAGGPGAWRLQAVAGFGFGATVVLLGLSPTYAVALVVVTLVGAAASAFQSLNNSMVLEAADFAYHGRIQSLMMLSFSGFGIAALPLGLLADAVGLRVTLVGMGVATLLTMVVYLVVQLNRRQSPTFSERVG